MTLDFGQAHAIVAHVEARWPDALPGAVEVRINPQTPMNVMGIGVWWADGLVFGVRAKGLIHDQATAERFVAVALSRLATWHKQNRNRLKVAA